MKMFRTQLAITLLTALVCTSFGAQQSQPNQTHIKYKFVSVNYPGASGTFAYAINDKGEIVGFYTGGDCGQPACGFTDVKGKFTSLSCVLQDYTETFDISNKGEIIGTYSYNGGVAGYVWEGNGTCNAFGPSSSLVEAWGVNDGGTFVGFYLDSANNFQGFEDRNNKVTNISCSQGPDTRALGINDAGVIVGDVSQSTSVPRLGIIDKAGKCTTFGFPKAYSTTAVGINKHNQVSGYYIAVSGGGDAGFVKTKNKFVTLNYPQALSTLAFHLNDNGQVAGAYEDSSGVDHGFVATPK